MYLTLGKTRLEARFWGNQSGSKPLIVLLHEGLGCVNMWKSFPQNLAESTGCPVFAWSRAGYGRSSPRPPSWPLSYMEDEAERMLPGVLSSTGAKKIILLGHSDGASIATVYCGQKHDDRIAGLVLVAPHFFVEEVSVVSISRARKAWLEGDLRKRLEKYHGANVDDAFWGWNGAWLDPEFRNWNITRFLAAIQVPVLAIQGANDQYGTKAHIETLERLCPSRVEQKILADCAHAPHLEQPDKTLAAIVGFINQLPE